MITSDFHGDGHPRDLTDLRLEELAAYYRMCRKQSDAEFLLIPSEEGDTILGGHWSIVFPKPVYWFMSKATEGPLQRPHAKYGSVYHVGSGDDIIEMVRREQGILYQTHPRTKSSFGYPDKVRDTGFFKDPRFIGAGWKAMPGDLSTLRQGVRALNLLDDMNNWGLPKRLLAETDMFAIDHTSEIYAHMNANYVRIGELPNFDNYGRMLEAVSRGDYFISMGQVLLPEVEISKASASAIKAKARIQWTFPLAFGEIVWGDGKETFTKTFDLTETRPIRQCDVRVRHGGQELAMGASRSVGRGWQRSIHQPGPPLASGAESNVSRRPSEQTVRCHRQFASFIATLLHNDSAGAIQQAVHAGKILRHFDQKRGVAPGCAFPCVKVGEGGPSENPRFANQHREWLMKTGCSEFQASRERLSILDMTPDIEPGIISRLEDVPD